jgi:hypothetical protein
MTARQIVHSQLARKGIREATAKQREMMQQATLVKAVSERNTDGKRIAIALRTAMTARRLPDWFSRKRRPAR